MNFLKKNFNMILIAIIIIVLLLAFVLINQDKINFSISNDNSNFNIKFNSENFQDEDITKKLNLIDTNIKDLETKLSGLNEVSNYSVDRINNKRKYITTKNYYERI